MIIVIRQIVHFVFLRPMWQHSVLECFAYKFSTACQSSCNEVRQVTASNPLYNPSTKVDIDLCRSLVEEFPVSREVQGVGGLWRLGGRGAGHCGVASW